MNKTPCAAVTSKGDELLRGSGAALFSYQHVTPRPSESSPTSNLTHTMCIMNDFLAARQAHLALDKAGIGIGAAPKVRAREPIRQPTALLNKDVISWKLY